ncbi:hypothetical protein [Anabaena azotica]|nr:hypothetical protein [Anabaena azotica]
MERSTSVFVTALVANGLSNHYKTEERLGVTVILGGTSDMNV